MMRIGKIENYQISIAVKILKMCFPSRPYIACISPIFLLEHLYSEHSESRRNLAESYFENYMFFAKSKTLKTSQQVAPINW